MLLAYCVRRAGDAAPDPDLKGIDGARVDLLEAEDLGLWVSAGVGGAATAERLREHDRVVRAALRSATPLPIRFGTGFRDEGRALEALRERREAFLEGLNFVAGRVEMGIRVAWEPPVPPVAAAAGREAGPGRAYLERRRREETDRAWLRERAEEVLRGVEGFFANLELPTERRVLPDPAVAGTLAHLVHRKDLGRYRERVERARNECLHVQLLPSGPWAPYSFV